MNTKEGTKDTKKSDETTVIELKSGEQVLSVHKAKILVYNKSVGLLINFNQKYPGYLKDGIKRYVL